MTELLRPKVLIAADAIAARVAELGAEISRDYRAADEPPVLICALKGGFVFLADLVRAIDLAVTVDFVTLSSYGAETASSGEVRVVKDFEVHVDGRDVLVVEDIVDTGSTLAFLAGRLRERGAKSVRVVALLDKRARRRVDVAADYVGFDIEDRFVVGYGLDYDERYRNLPYVGVLDD